MDVALYLQAFVADLLEVTAASSVGKLAWEALPQMVSFDSILHAQG